jgi:acetate kinase
MFGLPRTMYDKGIKRYGFHGLSYEYIVSALADQLGQLPEKLLVMHLGGGASAAAIKDGRSVATTMGMSALDGLIMGTRCGDIDPGVLLYLLQEEGLSISELERVLYKQSGLKGLSGISDDMRDLKSSDSEAAKEAITVYCHAAARQAAGLVPAIGGVDTVVFTGALGVHTAIVRRQICDGLAWLGINLDNQANENNSVTLTQESSTVKVLNIPTDEELVMARQAASLLTGDKAHRSTYSAVS